MNRYVKINLKTISALLLSLPIFTFFIGFLKIYVSVFCCLLLLIALCVAIKNTSNNLIIKLKVSHIFIFLLIACLWCFIGGIGGLCFQNPDQIWRNAIFRDLITKEWPVFYSSNKYMLVYYQAIWLIPALFGKLAMLATSNMIAVWFISNIALLIYCTIAIAVVFMMLVKILNVRNFKYMILLCCFFIIFAGMDIIGFKWSGQSLKYTLLTEQWSGVRFALNGFSNTLFYVYNQCIAAWICTLIIVNDKNIKEFAFWGLLAFSQSPLPFIGIFVFCIVITIQICIKKEKNERISYLCSAFSIQNLFSIFSVGIVFAMYYSINNSLSNHPNDRIVIANDGISGILYWLLFLIIEVVFFFILTVKNNKRNVFYWCCFFMMTFFPLYKIGLGTDFGMRATIPAILCCFIYVAMELKRLLHNSNKSVYLRLKSTIMVAVIIIGSVTSAVELTRGPAYCIEYKSLICPTPEFYSLDDKIGQIPNFTSDCYNDSLFYKYLSK